MSVPLADLAIAFGTVGGIIAYAIGGAMHVGIDAVHGRRMLRTYWEATDRKIANLQQWFLDSIAPLRAELEAVKADLPAPPDMVAFRQEIALDLQARFGELEKKLPDLPDFGAEFEGFLRSESGVSWATELAELIGTKFEKALTDRGNAARGASHRRTQLGAEEILLNSIDFGDERINALWALLSKDRKRYAVHNISKAISRAGFVLVPMTDSASQIATGVGGQVALPGPPADWDRF